MEECYFFYIVQMVPNRATHHILQALNSIMFWFCFSENLFADQEKSFLELTF